VDSPFYKFFTFKHIVKDKKEKKKKSSKLPGKVLLQIFGGLGKKPELKKN